MNKGKREQQKQEQLRQYDKMKAELEMQGYTEQNGVISIEKASVMSLLTAGPFAGIAILVYICTNKYGTLSLATSNVLKFFLVILVSIVIHEGIHGLTWHFFCKKKWKSIRFGVEKSTLTPYCHCIELLSTEKYVLGVLMPFFVLGVLPSILGIVMHSAAVTLFGALSILMAGGDTTIAAMLWKYKKALVLDHPYECGFVAFTK